MVRWVWKERPNIERSPHISSCFDIDRRFGWICGLFWCIICWFRLYLMQKDKVIADASRKLKVHECKNPTPNLKLVAVVFALKLWCHYLYGLHVDVFIDCKSLQYVFSQRDLNLRKKIWLKLLMDYDMSVLYYPYKANILADTLSRVSWVLSLMLMIERKSWSKRPTVWPGWE